MSFITKIGEFIARLFASAEKVVLEGTVLLVKEIEPILQSGEADILAQIADKVLGSQLPTEILAEVKVAVPVFLAEEAFITGITPTSTEAQVEAVLTQMVAAFPNLSVQQRGQLLTTLAAKIYVLVMDIKHGVKVTFGQAASLVEAGYQAWKSEQNPAPVVMPVPVVPPTA